MRQRNDSGSPLSIPYIPATDESPEIPPALVLPGDEIDCPERLAGFTPVEAMETKAPRTRKADTAEVEK